MNPFDWLEESYHLTNTGGSNKYDFIDGRYQCFSCLSEPGKKDPIKAIDANMTMEQKGKGRVRQKTLPCYHLNKVIRSSYGSKG